MISRRFTMQPERGFTLFEMLVVVAIIGVLSTILITNQSSFNKNNVLNDTAYTVALSIREMQSFGLSSRTFTATTTSIATANTGYGIHFGDSATYYDTFADTYPAASSVSNNYLYNCPHPVGDNGSVAARPGNCLYELSQGEQVQRYTLSNGYTISKVCYLRTVLMVTSNYCPPLTTATVDIVYERPNNQALINATPSGSSTIRTAQTTIDFTSPQGGIRCVIATELGQVYVSSTCP